MTTRRLGGDQTGGAAWRRVGQALSKSSNRREQPRCRLQDSPNLPRASLKEQYSGEPVSDSVRS